MDYIHLRLKPTSVEGFLLLVGVTWATMIALYSLTFVSFVAKAGGRRPQTDTLLVESRLKIVDLHADITENNMRAIRNGDKFPRHDKNGDLIVLNNVADSNRIMPRRKVGRWPTIENPAYELLPAPTPITPPELSFCLFFKEDNDKLLEWLSWHYYSGPIKHLMICEQPHAKEYAKTRLAGSGWNDLVDIQTVEAGKDYFHSRENVTYLQRLQEGDEELKYDLHRPIQGSCYQHCIKEMRSQGLSWVFFIDTDEFLIPRERPYNTKAVWSQGVAGYRGVFRKMIEEEEWTRRQCVYFPRIMFHNGTEFDNSDPRARFQTMNFKHHRFGYENAPGKSALDVSRLERFDYKNPHEKINPRCEDENFPNYIDPRKFNISLQANHYLGTRETYMYRKDPHRSEDKWNEKARKYGGIQDGKYGIDHKGNKFLIRKEMFGSLDGWVEEFVKDVGSLAAERLLFKGVGKHTTSDF